jgi:molybdopterin-binding protein
LVYHRQLRVKHQAIVTGAKQLRPNERSGFPYLGKRRINRVIRTAAGVVTSIITTGSVKRMNLKECDNVFAVVKAISVSIEKE